MSSGRKLEIYEVRCYRSRYAGKRGTEVASMDLANFVSMSSFWPPEHVRQPYSWVGHIPFAFWIVEASRPDVLVELGTHSGNSYFSFCQAVKRLNLPTLCRAVDNWQGDEHAGFYGEDVFQAVAERNRLEYDSFSTLIRSQFDEAHVRFDDGSIDLLHIDGLHTYEAVKHDFEMWLPRMSRRGIVLLHDTNVHERDFGVYLLFQELAQRYPTLEFLHSHGLGVIGVGADLPKPVRNLFEASGDESSREVVRTCYQRLGQVVLDQVTRADLEAITASLSSHLDTLKEHQLLLEKEHQLLLEAERQQYESELTAARTALAVAEKQIERQALQIKILEERASTLEAVKHCANDEIARLYDRLSAHRRQIDEIHQSLGWMLLNRARIVRDRLTRNVSGSGRCWTAVTRFVKSAVTRGLSGIDPPAR